ncbi:LysR family transcriptional regulator [uncultured Sulfitobacter sp.]|uniref:LysR family transcriptional regulator n=1 Tax=uncultured Sulfitobacter sp. TaxID=191468 RepID=UPI002612C646|nr:LysR family transcriptional regulator [uncultured Sulfitobacter sp.]
MRNLDITTLRSFVAVADAGGVTRAAGFLHLTQSAVSMQLKRLEEMLDMQLFDRSGRTIALTSSGEQLLAYARRMVALNDEVISRLTDQAFEGEMTLGVPHDIVYPAIPQVLKQFHALYPRVKVHLEASYTKTLKDQFARGACDIILTTEQGLDQGGQTLCTKDLIWVGAPGGTAWRQRPLQLAFCKFCMFRGPITVELDKQNIPWEMNVDTESDRAVEASVSADLAVHAVVDGTQPPFLERIEHGGALPPLTPQKINLYADSGQNGEVHKALVSLLQGAFQERATGKLRAV